MFRQALELGQPDFGQAPEAFDAVDMNGSFRKLVAGMIDADVAIAEIDEAVVAAPAIGVDDGARVHPAADNPLHGLSDGTRIVTKVLTGIIRDNPR